MIQLEQFLRLDSNEAAELVRAHGPRVVVCPINGTRRWFMLEAMNGAGQNEFLPMILDRYLKIFDLFFSHGIQVLLTPILGPDIVQRGSDYSDMVFAALDEITSGDRFLRYYENRDVRVRFYGDYEDYFAEKAPHVMDQFQQVQRATREHLEHKLFWGMFAHDPSETVSRIGIEYYKEQQSMPNRHDIVARYYGEYIPPADMFVGMMPPAVFDYPLLDTGGTALYFTTVPTPYLDQRMLRKMLHDFMFVRPVREEYESLSGEDWESLADFYHGKRKAIYGLGRKSAGGTVWLPED